MNKPMTNAENQEHNKQIVDKYNAKPNIIEIRKNNPPREVIRIAPDGKLFWNEREVETDDDFRSAMLDLAESLKQPTDLIRQQQNEIEDLINAHRFVQNFAEEQHQRAVALESELDRAVELYTDKAIENEALLKFIDERGETGQLIIWKAQEK